MQLIGNELKRLEERVIYLFEKCIEHDVQLVEFEDVAQCPRCFTESEHKTLEHKINNQFEQSKSFVLERKSLLSDCALLNASFENYRTIANSEADLNKRTVLECVQRIQNGQVFNITFQGRVGAGKSHLAYAILRALNSVKIQYAGDHFPVQKSCAFISFELMLRRVREAYTNPEQ